MRYLIKIQYDGSKFNGFQRLKENKSVQREIEEALSKISKENITIKGAGRTDRGVHAYAQMAHFDMKLNIPPANLKRAINSLINKYIYIDECMIVNDEFHARFNVKEKTYVYKINLGEYNPLKEDYYLQGINNLDISKMKKVSKLFIGIHDFENFVSGSRDNYQAIIYSIKFKKKKDTLEIEFKGKSFYRYMVRNLVGAMIDVALDKVSLEDVKNSLDKKTDKKFSTALSNGLYLMDIQY